MKSAGEPDLGPEAKRRVSERAQAQPSTIRVRFASVKIGLGSLPRRLAIGLIRVYQLTISPMLGPTCRFSPSCSHYSQACLRDHGLVRGSWLTLRRLSRCHPFHPGGYDPPPPALDAGARSGIPDSGSR